MIISGKRIVKCHKNLLGVGKVQSSTWTELKLKGMCFALDSLSKHPQNSNVSQSTDNYSPSITVSKASNESHLQDLALEINSLCIQHNIALDICWVRREFNTVADELLKNIGVNAQEVSSAFFNYLKSIWGSYTKTWLI